MLRRLKRDVMQQLPHKRRHVHRVAPPPDVMGTTREAKMEREAILREMAEPSLTPERRTALELAQKSVTTRLYRAAGRAKIRPALQLIQEILQPSEDGEGGGKVVVFAHHQEVLDALQDQIGVACVRIDGKTTSARKTQRLDTFQQEKDCKAALVAIKAAGTALDFTAAASAVFVELTWTPGELQQAEDRIHRYGQLADEVNVHYVVAEGTYDDEMWAMVEHKLSVLAGTYDEAPSSFGADAPTKSLRRGEGREEAPPSLTSPEAAAVRRTIEAWGGKGKETQLRQLTLPTGGSGGGGGGEAAAGGGAGWPHGMSEEVRARIERNRQEALRRRQRAEARCAPPP